MENTNSEHLSPAQLRAIAVGRAHAVIDQLTLPEGTALAATGSLARGELAPYSDVDLVLIHPATRPLDAEEVEAVWYPIWDAGLRLDSSVRTPEECAAITAEDERAGLALINLRHMRGDAELSARTRSLVLTKFRRTLIARLDTIADTAIARWQRSGSLVTMTRPDLKHSRGGLRDCDLLEAMALGNVADAPPLEEERRLLLDVRTLLHHAARRPRDILDPEFAVDIAEELGFADRYALGSALVAAATTIDDALTTAYTTARGLVKKSLSRGASIPLALDVIEKHGEVALSRDPDLEDPALLLRVAAASAHYGLPMSDITLKRLDALPPLPEIWTAAAARDFFALLASPAHTMRVVSALDKAGLWTRLVPEWAHVRALTPAEPSHVHTIDRHVLHTVARCAQVRTHIARPDLLLLAALYHDLGKRRQRPHEIVGAEMAARAARRLGLNLLDASRVQTLVAEHSTLAKLAHRFDPEDDRVRDILLDACHYDLLTIELLAQLTKADSEATGPGVYTRNLENFINVVVARARQALTTHRPTRPIVNAPGEIGLRRDHAGHVTVYWRGEDQRDVQGVVALLVAKAWELDAVRLRKDKVRGDYAAEFDVRPRTQRFSEALDEHAFVQAFKSKVYSRVSTPSPYPAVMHWHSGRLLEVRTVDRQFVFASIIETVPAVSWATATTPGGTSIIGLAFSSDVDRARVEKNITNVLGSC